MTKRRGAGAVIGTLAVTFALLTGCTGGQEGTAAEEQRPQKNPIVTESSAPSGQAADLDAQKQLRSISGAIPIYAGAKYRDDLTRRDTVMVRNQYGPNAQVYTLATDDSYPQVYHYYTTYLSQFRAFQPGPPYPPQQNWRSMEVQLNDAMQDPFIPGDAIRAGDKHVLLQVAETEAEPKTVIRYIVTPASQPVAAAVGAGSGN
jgi:hypothetical protein